MRTAGVDTPSAPTAQHVDDSTPVLVEDVTCRLGGNTVLDRVTFGVAAGTVVGIIGRNGAGKTTLLRSILGLVRPSSGRILVHGEHPDPSRAAFCRRVGYLPSGTRSFHLRLSGFENLRFFGRLSGMRGAVLDDRVHAALDAVDLCTASERPVGSYSTGMQRRLGTARLLLSGGSLLALDEPTHDLDREAAAAVHRALTGRARAGATVLWVTQRLEELEGFVDEVVVLDRGRVRFQGAPGDLDGYAAPVRFRITLRHRTTVDRIADTLGSAGRQVEGVGSREFDFTLSPRQTLGTAIAVLEAAGLTLVSCQPTSSPLLTALDALDAGDDRE